MKRLIALILLTFVSSTFGAWSWQSTQWNKGVNVQNTAGGGFKFVFPMCDAHVNAIQSGRPAIALNKVIVIQYKIVKLSGTPKFVSLDPAPAPPALKPNFRPMIQVDNDDYRTEDNRWWPSGVWCGFLALNMDGQVHELRIPVKANLWANVWGKTANTRPSAFKKVLGHSGKLNIVFGGGNSFSHGDCLRNGKAQFFLISLKVVNP